MKIKDAELLKVLTGEERIPVSNGSGKPVTATINLILEKASKFDPSEIYNRLDDLENNKADKILIINHDTNDVICSLTPNVYHKWDTVTNLTLTLADAPEDVYNEYMFQFTSGDTATTLSVPNTIQWVNQPNILSNRTYQCSIVNNIGILVMV